MRRRLAPGGLSKCSLIEGALEIKQWSKECGVGGSGTVGKGQGRTPGLFYAKDLSECKKGAVSEQRGWRPSRPWYAVAGPGSGDPQCFLLPSALPAKTSQPGGLRQPQRTPREARVSMATLTSWTWGPERCHPPPPAGLAQPQLCSAAAGRDIRGVGAAALPSDLSCAGPHRCEPSQPGLTGLPPS